MFIVRHRNIFFALTIILTIFSVGAMIVRGLNFGIDFTGGSILEVSYEGARPEQAAVAAKLDSLSLGAYSLRPSGENGFVLRTKELNPETKNTVVAAFTVDQTSKANEDRFNSIGPAVGGELRNKAYVAIAVTVLCIVLFITFAFRKVSEPVQSWKYGLTTIVALVHDIIVSAGVFIALSYFTGAEIDLLFMTALLAILGYSVHDTIVVFDRVRETLRVNRETHRREDFEITVGRSISQTMGRSINTSLTLIFVLIALYIVGGVSTQPFALLLLLGVVAGTYSSICLAAPLLVTLERFSKKNS
jgi:preprotein translocase subunit SecF